MPRKNTQSIPDLFWGKVNRAGPIIQEKLDACWIWEGGKQLNGYGRFFTPRPEHRTYLAHRFSWILAHGNILENSYVLHRCDNPPCVRPTHLFLGSQADNRIDCMLKIRNPNRKLSPENVREIRQLLSFKVSQQSIADKFGVTQVCISHIHRNTSWSYLQ